MYIERKQDRSMFYYIKDILDAESNGQISVVDGFPAEVLTLPTVSVENSTLTVRPLELGNRKGYDLRIWFIDVFTENKTQRDDYSYLIKNKLQEGIPVYNYDEGFPPNASPSQIGSMDVQELEIYPVKVLTELVSTLYWRAQIRVLVRYTITP